MIKKIDLGEVWKSEGVISVVGYKDIPGRNDVGPVFDGDPIFPPNKVEYYGQPLFAVAATSTELASAGGVVVTVNCTELAPKLSLLLLDTK